MRYATAAFSFFFFYPSYSPTTFSQYFINSLLFCFLRFRIVYSCHPYTQTLTHTHTHVLLHTGFHLSFSDSNSTNDTLFSINWSPLSLFFCICSIKPQFVSPHLFFFCLLAFQSHFSVSQLKDPFLNLYSFFFSFLCSLRRLLFLRAQIYIYIYIPLPFSLVLLSVTGASPCLHSVYLP